ncbi:T9SS type A sorting domain-containing protein [Ferruginibacter sp. HRS2-29]|uniref:T9SS type A sorting domain-containing protein n=1 Tax=Ferruginibacter sp. HRS2-29 TaxID=2487334 RepID=UPI0020CD3134|nr:T9SS type A sorting domain-containing protein [Ferruginibacter sp. HRS2-29]MCP9751004.1 T9SS C-terminal target domain-containing protein [Ferruginibacter sp. HRS2-29]
MSKKFYLGVFALLTFSYAQAQTHEYLFNNSFNEASANGPALTEVLSCGAAAGSFTTQLITTSAGTCGTTPRQVFAFNEGGGLAYDNQSFITGSYSIHIFFEFNLLSGYQRIIDFKNSTTDRGMYTLSNCLNFYSNGNVGTCPFFVANTYYLISIVRDAATNLVNVYVNGQPFVTNYNDAAGDYNPASTTSPILFFRDDNPVACEDRDGTVKYISLKNAVSTPAEVLTVFNNICTVVLPLTLKGFAATQPYGQQKVQLKWTTENEINSSHFEVERSTDGQNFAKIADVSAKGGTVNNYSLDDAAGVAPTLYYRLKIMDRDGKFTYSNIARVNNTVTDKFYVYPNPAVAEITIGGLKKTGMLLLYNAEGKLVQQQKVNLLSTTMYISQLAKGMYVLKYVADGKTVHQKIVKQ